MEAQVSDTPVDLDAARDARQTADQNDRVVAAMRADGIVTEEPVIIDYFAQDAPSKVMLPDGVQYVLVRKFNEGERRKYMNATNRDVRIQKVTGDALMNMKPGDERKAKLETAITGWHLYRSGQELPYNDRNKREMLDLFPPAVIDKIDKEISLLNPWMLNEMSSEDIEKEIADLQELLAKKKEEEAGNGGSASK